MHDPALPDAATEPYWPAVGQDPKTVKHHHHGRGRKAKLQAMILIDIFKENHRFSEQTPHPAPHSVVGAANLAASSRGSKTDFRSL